MRGEGCEQLANAENPIEVYSHLRTEIAHGCAPNRAAELMEKGLPWRWERVEFTRNAPSLIAKQEDNIAWRRFEAASVIVRKQVAAHFLFRAAGYETGATRALLMELGDSLLWEIVNEWLKGRR
jgi:hypothetical protein